MSSSESPQAPSTSDGSGSDIVNYTALVVALVALVVSMLQLILQYILSAEGRSKVGAAAIGVWAQKNRYYWRPWRAKLYIKVRTTWNESFVTDPTQYVRPSISIPQFLHALRVQGAERKTNLNTLIHYKITEITPSTQIVPYFYTTVDRSSG